MNSILEIKDIQIKRGGIQILNISSLELKEGEILSIIGPNGAGKSTLLLTLASLLKPEKGILNFKSKKISSKNEIFSYRRRIAMVFQEPLLFDTTVYKNVASGLSFRKVNRKEISDTVEFLLNRFGIKQLALRSAKKLSGGETQRTSLARAFAVKPEILFLDEPFSSLDPPTREGLIKDLIQILNETKTTAVMTTHDLMEAIRISNRIAVLNHGSIAQIGTPEEIIHKPYNEFVASFVNMEKVLLENLNTINKFFKKEP